VVAAVIAQFLLAGLGVFATVQVGGFGPHRLYGATAVLLGILLLIVFSFVSRAPWRYTGLAGLLLLQFFLQYVFLQFYWHAGSTIPGTSWYVSPDLRPIAALHVLNGLVILWVALHIADRSTAAQPTPR
jgi:hypothetical protein